MEYPSWTVAAVILQNTATPVPTPAVSSGALVDADMGREAAKLQANDVRVKLAAQSLSIASGSPQWLLSLFKR